MSLTEHGLKSFFINQTAKINWCLGSIILFARCCANFEMTVSQVCSTTQTHLELSKHENNENVLFLFTLDKVDLHFQRIVYIKHHSKQKISNKMTNILLNKIIMYAKCPLCNKSLTWKISHPSLFSSQTRNYKKNLEGSCKGIFSFL